MTATTNATNATGSAAHKGGAARKTVDAVLDAGAALIDKNGWQGTTLEQVAKHASARLEDVLRDYPTRDHLAVAIFDRILDATLSDLSEEIEAKAHLDARLLGMLAREIRLLGKHKGFAREALRRLFVPFTPAIALQAPLAARFIAHTAEQIEAARDRGQIHRWVIPSVAATAFWALHLQILAAWLRNHRANHESTLAVADRRIRTFVRTLGGEAQRRRPTREPTEEAVFKAIAGKSASQAIEIHNTEVDAIDADLKPTQFRSEADRNQRIHPEFQFSSERDIIEPDGSATIMATITIPSSLTPGVPYRGKLYIPGVESAAVAAVLIRLPDPGAGVDG